MNKFINKKFLVNALPYFCLILIVGSYQLLTINRYLPVQEGWFNYYSELIYRGKIPYRDFYLYIQPVYMFIMDCIYKLSRFFSVSSILSMRIFGIVERIILVLLIYKIVSKINDRFIAFLCLVIAYFFYSSFNVDLPYSYYQTALFITILATVFMFNFITNERAGFTNIINIFLAGLFTAMAFLTKQSSGILFSLFFIIVLILYAYRYHTFTSLLKYLVIYIAGYLLPLIFFGIWLVRHDTVRNYFNQVYISTSSKGALRDILFGFIPRLFDSIDIRKISLYIILFILVYFFAKKSKSKKNANYAPYSGFLVFTCLIIASFLYSYFTPGLIENFLFLGNYQTIDHYLSFIIFFTVILIVFKAFYVWIINPYDKKNMVFLYLSAVSFIWMFAHGMSGVLEIHALLLAFPVVFLFLWDILKGDLTKKIFLIIFVVFSISSVIIISSSRYKTPYYWWGWGEPDVREARFSSKIPELEGFYLSASSLTCYEDIYNLIMRNSTPQDEVYFFPHISLFNVLTRRVNSSFSAINYFDVCSDKYALKTAEYIKNFRPKIILFMHFPEDAWVTHENIFRAGKRSGQREIAQVINTLRENGIYKRVYYKQVNNCYPIEVLVRN
ncbi:MAG: hypothetical protein PHV30_04920 [Candidatus Margulisbacteria bacterium]|nr:hypothetical protein [Candidatus Margulisiibacteriota bacterium]